MKKKSLGEVFIGLIVLAVGIGLFADALDLVRFGSLASQWWPLAVIGAGVLSFLSNPRIWWWPTIFILIGSLLLVDRLDLVAIHATQLIWPSIIMIVGFGILFERAGGGRQNRADDTVSMFVAFAGSEERVTSQDFKGGRISALFGGVDVDLNDAKLNKDGASIDVFTFCGGVDVRVPEGWVVKVNGLPLLGGWENKTKAPANPDKAPVLQVRGTCVLGGFGIKNGRPND